jgi:broad specificity phosphatase PhoE
MIIHYFVHSTSTDNETGIRAGWSDPGLSDVGMRQARALADQVANLKVDTVFASDLRRAAETARTTFPETEVRLDARLREMNYGVLNGKADHLFPEDEAPHIGTPYDDGESCLDVEARVRDFLGEAAANCETIAVVSHRFPQLALEVICNGLDWEVALAQDWRRAGAWRPGWEYRYTI